MCCLLWCVGYPCETLDLQRVGKRRQSQPAARPWEMDSSMELDDAQLAALIAATAGVDLGPTSLGAALPAAAAAAAASGPVSPNDSQQVFLFSRVHLID